MEADDCDGLPMYIEDDEEEAAAEKQKRRQQSQKLRAKLPWEDETPEEKATRELNLAMVKKLYEYDPEMRSGYYTRVWFVDLTLMKRVIPLFLNFIHIRRPKSQMRSDR
ncbi:hypothetical protein PAHAL_5G053800 [Panicum hallii]|jgi:hypothetical protein|uniref:Uncharacterized protein n=1 Tax=Panicum hallii TaxID=206008 RepID=A0A2S3HNZ1_9POAL|nr:hypothetical protein PAHAL_5G053800 [Panicum hallii]